MCELKYILSFIRVLSGYIHSQWRTSYGSWIYNYLCNQCIFTTEVVGSNHVHARCTWYNIT